MQPSIICQVFISTYNPEAIVSKFLYFLSFSRSFATAKRAKASINEDTFSLLHKKKKTERTSLKTVIIHV